jgi:hypothetical protein
MYFSVVKISLVYLILICPFSLFSQSWEFMPVYGAFYPGVSHYFSFRDTLGNCAHIFFQSDNGRVEKCNPCEDSCTFRFVPRWAGGAYIQAFQICKGDTSLVAEKNVVVNIWPEHKAQFGHLKQGTISKASFLAHRGVNIPIAAFDMSGNIPVRSFRIQLVRYGELMLELHNNGGVFEERNRAALQAVQKGDEVYFTEIKAVMPGELREKEMNDIYLRIE